MHPVDESHSRLLDYRLREHNTRFATYYGCILDSLDEKYADCTGFIEGACEQFAAGLDILNEKASRFGTCWILTESFAACPAVLDEADPEYGAAWLNA